MQSKHVNYLTPSSISLASNLGLLGSLGNSFLNPNPIDSTSEFLGSLVGGSAGIAGGIYGGHMADRLISPKNSNIGNAIGLLMAAGLPITGTLLGTAIGERMNNP